MLPETPRGNKYALTVVDYFTKFKLAHALREKSAETVVEKLYETYTVFQIPGAIISDNGKSNDCNVEPEMRRIHCMRFKQILFD